MTFIMNFLPYILFEIYDIIYFLKAYNNSHIDILDHYRIFCNIQHSILVFKNFISTNRIFQKKFFELSAIQKKATVCQVHYLNVITFYV